MIVLGIESSHDDTSISIVKDKQVLVYLKISQVDIHRKYGGTIPEIASREHFQNFYILLEKLKENFDLNNIDLIAYTEEPGLIGALQMGKIFAHSLAKMLNKPLIPINHLDGHIFSVLLDNEENIIYPAIALVVSGGHTSLYHLKSDNEKILLGQTQDDAAGEVFDKVSRVLFDEFPGGPKIDQVFNNNLDKDLFEYVLKKPNLENKYDFSFSGYKTQIVNMVNSNKNIDKEILAATFQKNIVDFMIEKVYLAISEFSPNSIILSGGVSANSYLRNRFINLHDNALIPEIEYATDNGAMIAIAAIKKMSRKI